MRAPPLPSQFTFFIFASFVSIPALLINFNAGTLRTDQLDVLHLGVLSVANVAGFAASTNATIKEPWGPYVGPGATITNRQASLVLMAVDFTIIALFLLFAVFLQLMIKRGASRRRAPLPRLSLSRATSSLRRCSLARGAL